MRKHYTLTLVRTFLNAAGICGLFLAGGLATSGCGPEKQSVTAPPPLNSGPPAGSNKDEYMQQMQKMKGAGGGTTRPGGMGGPGGPPGGPR